MKYVAEIEGKWVALLGWGTAAFKCGPRDQQIGWSKEQQWQRLVFIANNLRFLILPGVRIPNLASKVLSLNVKRMSSDWQAVFGHPVVLAETFIDHSRFTRTCYQATGWVPLDSSAATVSITTSFTTSSMLSLPYRLQGTKISGSS